MSGMCWWTAAILLALQDPAGSAEVEIPFAVRARLVGPSQWSVGTTQELTIRLSTSGRVAGAATVAADLPAGLAFVSGVPEPLAEALDDGGTRLTWTLEARDGVLPEGVRLSVTAERAVAATIPVTVSARGTLEKDIRVTEPKLRLRVLGPERVVVGAPFDVRLVVANTGEGDLTGGSLRITKVSDGLRVVSAPDPDGAAGLVLATGRSLSVPVTVVADRRGPQGVQAVAAVAGREESGEWTVNASGPAVTLSFTGAGNLPEGHPAAVAMVLRNAGDSAATDVGVFLEIPPNLRPTATSQPAGYDGGRNLLYWELDELPAGKELRVDVRLDAPPAGVHSLRGSFRTDRGSGDTLLTLRVGAGANVRRAVSAEVAASGP